MYHLKRGDNCALLGCPGTGKTTTAAGVVEQLIEEGHKVLVTGTTGAAVQPIGDALTKAGTPVEIQTIHSLLHFHPKTSTWIEEGRFEKVEKWAAAQLAVDWSRLREAEILLVEEVSMMTGNFLKAVDICTRVHRRKPSKKFGGLVLLLVGDFRQLPPVSRTRGRLFEHRSWKESVDHIFNLEVVVRQCEDPRLGEIVLAMSHNCLTSDQKTLLQTRVVPEGGRLIFCPDFLSDALRVFDINDHVNEYNRRVAHHAVQSGVEHRQLSGRLEGLKGGKKSSNKVEASFFPVLFQGAKAVLTSNVDVDGGLANGTPCTIVGFCDVENEGGCLDKKKGCPCFGFRVTIRTERNETFEIGCHPRIGDGSRFHHVPLRLWYACTVHKLQGRTLNGPLFYMGRPTKENHTALYVVCTRATRLDHLNFASLPEDLSHLVEPRVVEWYRSITLNP